MPMRPSQPNISVGGAGALSVRFWLLLLITGVGAGLAAGGLMLLLRATQHLAWAYRSGTFLAAVRGAAAIRQVAVLLLAGLAAGAYRWLHRLNPGGHAGELAETIWFRCGRLPLLATVARAVLSIVLVGMGAALGREAAPKQTGAAIASALAGWGRLSPTEWRLLAACGAGAGMGAIYNIPFGGALFALEVLLDNLALSLVAPALAASLIATATSWLVLPNAPTYVVPPYGLSIPVAVWAVAAGPLAGLVAVGYIRLIAFADAAKPGGWRRFIVPVVAFAALGGLATQFPELLGNGKDVVQELLLGRVALPLLAILLVLRPLAAALCLGSGAPGGLFTPTLTLGALFGALLGQLWAFWWPGAPIGGYVIIGAAAMLAAAMQAPVCALVIVMELMHHLEPVTVPLMVAIAGATIVVRRFEPRSIYSARIHHGRQWARADKPPLSPAFAGLASQDFNVISGAASQGEVLQELIASDARGRPLYVVDEKGRFIGAVSPDAATGAAAVLTIAADLANRVSGLPSSASRDEVLCRIRAANGMPLPVIQSGTGRPIGTTHAPPIVQAASLR
jgi:chloride channel protein, CIC family